MNNITTRAPVRRSAGARLLDSKVGGMPLGAWFVAGGLLVVGLVRWPYLRTVARMSRTEQPARRRLSDEYAWTRGWAG